MRLHSYRLKNFRRLKNAHIELSDDISIFLGSNNSGKTSATILKNTDVPDIVSYDND